MKATHAGQAVAVVVVVVSPNPAFETTWENQGASIQLLLHSIQSVAFIQGVDIEHIKTSEMYILAPK